MTRRDKLTPLGKAIRQRGARLRSGWEHDYGGAIADARRNNVARLVDCLRAHKPLTDDDFDRLADYVEMTAKRRRGREQDKDVHDAAQYAENLMAMIGGKVSASVRTRVIEFTCKQFEREGRPVDSERVRDLLSRPRSRRR